MKLKLTVSLALLAAILTTPALADTPPKQVAPGEAVKPRSSEPAAGTPWTEPKAEMGFVWIPSGCFQMGSSDGDKSERPVHKVCVKGFWMGRYEVTQAQYQKIMGNNPSIFKGSDNPVEMVSWENAKNFAEKMSTSTGTNVNLPSEAQWEYACRAGGAHEAYCGGGRIDQIAWYEGNSSKTTHTIGQLAPNDWGLYDMTGNVNEWVADTYHDSYNGAPTDGSAWVQGGMARYAVMRGGSWKYGPAVARSTLRYLNETSFRRDNYGFRLARTLP